MREDLFQLAFHILPHAGRQLCNPPIPCHDPLGKGSVLTPRLGPCINSPHSTDLDFVALQLLQAIPAGVGQVMPDNPWTGGVFLSGGPVHLLATICLHAATGSESYKAGSCAPLGRGHFPEAISPSTH